MDLKVVCVLLLVACAYGAVLPSASSAVKPVDEAAGQGEAVASGLISSRSGKSRDDSDSDSDSDSKDSDSDEKSDKKEEKHDKKEEKKDEKKEEKKEEKQIGKLVKELALLSEKLQHSANLKDIQTKNLVLSINALIQQLVRLGKNGQLKDENNENIADLLESLGKEPKQKPSCGGDSDESGKSSEEDSKKKEKDVRKLVKEMQKITEKLIGLVGRSNIEARNILLSLKALLDQLAGLPALEGGVSKVVNDIGKAVSGLLG